MNLELSEEQNMLKEAVDKFFRQESTSARVRAVEALGHDADLWAGIVDMGLPMMRVPEARGGGDMSLFDAVLVAELAGRHLASAPLVEAMVVARLLAQVGTDVACDWLDRLGGGDALVTLALASADVESTQLVPAAAVADAIVYLRGGDLHLKVVETKPEVAAGHTLPMASCALEGESVVLASGEKAQAAYQAALLEWKVLTAATLGGLARATLEQASAYACERYAFDRPIGSYQGLAHPMADAVTDIDGGQLAIWLTISDLARGSEDAAAQLSLVFWWMTQAAPKATVIAMRAFGGYGMTLEYDAQLFFRRVRGLALVAGDPRKELSLGGEWLIKGASGHAVPQAGDIGIDFDYGQKAAEAAEEMRQFMAENLTDELRTFARETLDGFHPEFLKKLAAARLLYPDWPKFLGGGERTSYEVVAMQGVMADNDWMFALPGVVDIIGKTLMYFGSEKAKQEILPKIATGDAYCAMGYSEPSCGSDVFAAKTKAVKDGDDWIIDGQKMFTSQGHLADYVLVLARTNPDVPKHAGLTMFLVPTNQEGYECHEVETLHQERTNITYYSGMRVPDRYRIGEVDGGVKVMAAALAMEQGTNAYFSHNMLQIFRHARHWITEHYSEAKSPVDADAMCQVLGRLGVRMLITEALTRRAIWAAENKCVKKSYGPMGKLFATESWQLVTRELMELTAPYSLTGADDFLVRLELEHRRGVPSTVYAGTSEVQRSTVAEDALQLPRTRS